MICELIPQKADPQVRGCQAGLIGAAICQKLLALDPGRRQFGLGFTNLLLQQAHLEIAGQNRQALLEIHKLGLRLGHSGIGPVLGRLSGRHLVCAQLCGHLIEMGLGERDQLE